MSYSDGRDNNPGGSYSRGKERDVAAGRRQSGWVEGGGLGSRQPPPRQRRASHQPQSSCVLEYANTKRQLRRSVAHPPMLTPRVITEFVEDTEDDDARYTVPRRSPSLHSWNQPMPEDVLMPPYVRSNPRLRVLSEEEEASAGVQMGNGARSHSFSDVGGRRSRDHSPDQHRRASPAHDLARPSYEKQQRHYSDTTKVAPNYDDGQDQRRRREDVYAFYSGGADSFSLRHASPQQCGSDSPRYISRSSPRSNNVNGLSHENTWQRGGSDAGNLSVASSVRQTIERQPTAPDDDGSLSGMYSRLSNSMRCLTTDDAHLTKDFLTMDVGGGDSNRKLSHSPDMLGSRRRLPPTPDQLAPTLSPMNRGSSHHRSTSVVTGPTTSVANTSLSPSPDNPERRSGLGRRLPEPPQQPQYHQSQQTIVAAAPYNNQQNAMPKSASASSYNAVSNDGKRSASPMSQTPPDTVPAYPTTVTVSPPQTSTSPKKQITTTAATPVNRNYRTGAEPGAPPPTLAAQPRTMTMDGGNVPGYDHGQMMSEWNTRRLSSEQSLDRHSGSTAADSQVSSLSPSMEHLTSKSSSETEDPAAYGLDPKLYGADANLTTAGSDSGDPQVKTPNKAWPDLPIELKQSGGLGTLHYSMQYFPVRKRLRVNVMKCEGVAGQLRPDLELQAFAKICLNPGKVQKQTSRIVKRTRDIIFGDEYFFDNVSAGDFQTKSVCIRICHHIGKQFHKDVVIGYVDVPLKEVQDLSSKREVLLVENLKPKINTKKLGKLHISSCLEKTSMRLTINVIKVDDLPKYGISGPPDPFVKITVDQQGKIQVKQTRVLKNCCSCSWKEAVMFLVSTDPDDLRETRITIGVHDASRTTTGHDLIGVVYLGKLAQEKPEIDQWKSTVNNPGKDHKVVHTLKVPQEMLEEAKKGEHSDDE